MTNTPDNDRHERDLEEDGHFWHPRIFGSMKIKCCMNCGFIKNEDQPNKPCPGLVRVELRAPHHFNQEGK